MTETKRGKPKAALVSIEDYQRLHQEEKAAKLARWQAWLASSDQLSGQILQRPQEEFVDVTATLQAARADLEARDGWLITLRKEP
jgi:hypothetical protein